MLNSHVRERKDEEMLPEFPLLPKNERRRLLSSKFQSGTPLSFDLRVKNIPGLNAAKVEDGINILKRNKAKWSTRFSLESSLRYPDHSSIVCSGTKKKDLTSLFTRYYSSVIFHLRKQIMSLEDQYEPLLFEGPEILDFQNLTLIFSVASSLKLLFINHDEKAIISKRKQVFNRDGDDEKVVEFSFRDTNDDESFHNILADSSFVFFSMDKLSPSIETLVKTVAELIKRNSLKTLIVLKANESIDLENLCANDYGLDIILIPQLKIKDLKIDQPIMLLSDRAVTQMKLLNVKLASLSQEETSPEICDGPDGLSLFLPSLEKLLEVEVTLLELQSWEEESDKELTRNNRVLSKIFSSHDLLEVKTH